MQKQAQRSKASRPAPSGGLEMVYADGALESLGGKAGKPNLLTTVYSELDFFETTPSAGTEESTGRVALQDHVGPNFAWLCAEHNAQPRSAWAQTGVLFDGRENLRSALAEVRKTAQAVDRVSFNNWHEWSHVVLQSPVFGSFKSHVQPLLFRADGSPAFMADGGPGFGDNPYSRWYDSIFEAETPAALVARLRRALQLAFRQFLSYADCEILKALRRLNKSIHVVLHMLERPQRLHEFIAKQRSWHLLHGARPPRGMALVNTLFNRSMLGVPA